MKVREVRRYDSEEAERFEAMLKSPSWRTYCDRVEAVLRNAVERCVREGDDVELRRAQGAAVAVRAVVDMPAAILMEMKAGK